MDRIGRVALGGPRFELYEGTLAFVGVDLTGADFRMQARLAPNTPGTPVFDLLKVTTGAAQGVRLVYGGTATYAAHVTAGRLQAGALPGVADTASVTLSLLGIRVNKGTMEGLPYTGGPGEDDVFAFDLQVTPSGSNAHVWVAGEFWAEAAVTGANSALPGTSPVGYGSGRSRSGAGVPAFQIGNTVVQVLVNGAQGPRGLPSGPLGSGSVGAGEVSDDAAEQLAITGKLLTKLDLPGAIGVPAIVRFNRVVAVTEFPGADTENDADHTDAWNLATQAAGTYNSGNDSPYKYQVYVPAPRSVGGRWRLGASGKRVYVRKGQHLHGDGIACAVDLRGVAPGRSSAVPIIVMGAGSATENDVGGDVGGTATQVSGFWFEGCPSSCAVIDTSRCAGWKLNDLFFTSCARAILAGGGDGLLTEFFIDQCLLGVDLNGQNITIAGGNIYLPNYGIRVMSAFDCIIANMLISYPKYAGIQIGNGNVANTNIRGLAIEGNTLAMNEQFATNQGLIIVDCSDPRVRIANNMLRNGRLAAIKRTQGVGGYVVIQGNTFDRIKSNPVYEQSVSMNGVDWAAGDVDILDNRFLFQVQPIRMAPGEATAMTAQGNRFAGTNGPSSVEIKVDNVNGASSLTLVGNAPSPLLLTNPQATVPVFGRDVVSGSVTLAAGTATIAAALVRNSSIIRLAPQAAGGTPGVRHEVTRTPGVGFTITAKDSTGATQAADTSTIAWSLELAGA